MKLTSKNAAEKLDELNAELRKNPGDLRRALEADLQEQSKRKRNFEREASQSKLKK